MKNKYIININGKIGDEKSSFISVLDKGFLYGDSVYDVTYAKNGNPIFLDEHIDRLWRSAALIDIEVGFNKDFFKQQIAKTLSTAQQELSYMRFIITRGEGDIDISSTPERQNFIIIIKPLSPYPEQLYDKGISLYLGERLRNHKLATNPNAKSGNYLNSVLAVREAVDKGFDDALLKNSQGFIAEGSTFNIWIIKDGVIKTPHEECGLLEGITREKILSLNSDELKIEKAYLTEKNLYDSDAIFISSSTKGIMPVYKINSISFKVDNEQLSKVIKAYNKLL